MEIAVRRRGRRRVVQFLFFLFSSSSLPFLLFLQPHFSEVCLVAVKVWAHLAMILPKAETKCTFAPVSTGCEPAREMPLRVISAIVEHRFLAEVGLRTLVAGAAMTAMVD